MAGAPDRPIEAVAADSMERDVAPPFYAGVVAAWRSLTFFQTLFLIYMVFGLLIMTFMVPPFQKPDEPSHWYRAVSVSNFDFACSKDRLGVYKVDMKSKWADLPVMVHEPSCALR